MAWASRPSSGGIWWHGYQAMLAGEMVIGVEMF